MKKKTINQLKSIKNIFYFALILFILLVSACSHQESSLEEEIYTDELPLFSKSAGFYNENFDLILNSELENEIYYTLDGSDPRKSKTAILYNKKIPIYDNTNEKNVFSAIKDISLAGYNPPEFNVDKGICVRAVIYVKDKGFGKVVTNTYFVGKLASYYSEMKVVSLVTDGDYLFDEDDGAYMIGKKYYDWKNSSSYEELDPSDVNNVTNYNTDGKESEFPVTIQIFEDGNAVYKADVGARISGNWSRSHPQKSIRFYARKDYGTDSIDYAFFDDLYDVNGKKIVRFDKVTLRNGGNDFTELHFRDALIQDLLRDLSCDLMEADPCILFINGEFWGFYMFREKVDGDYFKSHYGISKKNIISLKNSEVEEGEDSDLAEFADFCKWVETSDMSKDDNYQTFCSKVDVESFIDYVAVETYINNSDWASDWSNNWQIWRTKIKDSSKKNADGKWRFIFYDMDFSAGIYDSLQTKSDYDLLNNMYVNEYCFFRIPKILESLSKNAEFKQNFYSRYLNIIENNFNSERVIQKIDDYVSSYKNAINDTHRRFGLMYAYYDFDNQVDDLKTFFEERPNYAKQYLKNYCGVE